MDTLFVTFLVFVILLLSAFFSRREDRPFFLIFIATSFYYTVGGFWYWSYQRGSEFLGVYWGEDLDRAAIYLSLSSALVFYIVLFISKVINSYSVHETVKGESAKDNRLLYIFVVLGFIGSVYVLVSSASYGGLNTDDYFVLIAYQFSDLLIPSILFYVATRGFKANSLLLVVYFTFYAVFVGLRYKLLLLYLPVFSWLAFSKIDSISMFRRRLILLFAGLSLLSLFSLMTTGRQKFNALDFSSSDFSSSSDALYGFFAETNSLFGLITSIRGFIDGVDPPYIYFQPFIDAVLDFLPRFLFPWREISDYYIFTSSGLLSEEASNSGTTYPFLGEYILMFGSFGIIFGCVVYALLYLKISRLVIRFSKGHAGITDFGLFLMATFFGYYFYSRGFIPQIVKGVVFVVLPYLFLSKSYYNSDKGRG